MGRSPCCSKEGLNRGPWTAKKNDLLTNYIQQHGEGHWDTPSLCVGGLPLSLI